jgi:hypothetical protein
LKHPLKKKAASLVLQTAAHSDETHSIMKRLQKPLVVVLLCVGTAVILGVSAFAQEKDGQVRIMDARIEIRPGTTISDSDQKALNEVLKKYNTSLYKIETVKDGNVTGKPQGTLEDKHIDATLAAEVKQAKAAGASVQMEQVVDHKTAVVEEDAKSKELIKALKPILEKYSKK